MVFGYNVDEMGLDVKDIREYIISKFTPRMLKKYKGYDKDDDLMWQLWMDFYNRKNPFGLKDIGVVMNDGNDYIGVVIVDSYSNNCALTEDRVFGKTLMKKVQRAEKNYLKKIKAFREKLGIIKEPKLLKGVWNW
jgi:hypothetical protein